MSGHVFPYRDVRRNTFTYQSGFPKQSPQDVFILIEITPGPKNAKLIKSVWIRFSFPFGFSVGLDSPKLLICRVGVGGVQHLCVQSRWDALGGLFGNDDSTRPGPQGFGGVTSTTSSALVLV